MPVSTCTSLPGNIFNLLIVDHPDPNTYVNTKEMLNDFSKEIIFVTMLLPFTQTLFVELVRFVPGQPDNVPTNGSVTRSVSTRPPAPSPSSRPHALSHPLSQPSHAASTSATPAPTHSTSTLDLRGPISVVNPHLPPPPPPWSRWGTVSTPLRPPSTLRRQPTDHARSTPPQSSKKRKHAEEVNGDDATKASSSSRARSPKRRVNAETPPSVPTPPSGPTARPTQALSPSLAIMLSPTVSRVAPRPPSSIVGPSSNGVETTNNGSTAPVRKVNLVVKGA
jgi:[histone H3]-trimethyl-L-lysine4 demethylase